MSSDLLFLDEPFFSDQFSAFQDTPIEVLLQQYSDHHQIIPQNPVPETSYSSADQIAHPIFSSSPPSDQLENLSLYQTTQLFTDFSSLDVKTEECHQFPYGFEPFGRGNAAENAARMMQRSLSSHSFDGKPSSFSFQPRFDCVVESPHFQAQAMSDPENSFSVGQMRRVYSAGDLHKIKTTQPNHRLSSSPLATEGSFIDEANLKVGRYSAEERKERIHRYRAKRTQRNFNKTIKYACRKTLADNRPRIRGRFARNDEAGEIIKAANFNRYEDEDDLWAQIDGYNGEDEERSVVGGGGQFFNILGPTQIQYYGY